MKPISGEEEEGRKGRRDKRLRTTVKWHFDINNVRGTI